MKAIIVTAFLSVMACPGIYAQTLSDASFGATVYAQQSMANNDTPAYMVEWAAKTNGAAVSNDKADIANHVTTLNIDASAIGGTVSSVSVYAHSKAAIAGALMYNGATSAISMPAGTPVSAYASSGQSDVVTVVGTDKTCKAYLLPVALKGGVKVTVRTDDGKFYSQDFTEDIAAGATKTLALTNVAANNLWMATIPGNTYFSFVSTPGAHDAATSGVTGITASYAKCQGEDIATLLANGVRAFDLRPNYKNNSEITSDNLYIYHGTYNTNVKYVDAMKALVDFVKANPSEAVSVVMVKEAGSGNKDRSDEMWSVINACHSSYSDYMKLLDHSYYTLDDFRGKICYVNRTGTDCINAVRITNWPDNGNVTDYSSAIGNTCFANIQDMYNSNGNTKQEEIMSMLQKSSENKEKKNFHYNFCSSAYKAFGSAPATYAKATNPVITAYLNEGNISGSAGYVYADYIGSQNNGGAALLSAIVCQNYRYVYNGMSADGAQQNGANWDLTLGSDFCWTKKGNWADAYGTQNGEMHVTENYAGWGSIEQTDFALTRKVMLAPGAYRLQGYALYRDGATGGAKLVAKAGSTTLGSVNVAAMTSLSSSEAGEGGSADLRKAANSFVGDAYLNTMTFTLAAPAEVTVGFEGKHTATKQWFVAGPVSIERIDGVTRTVAEGCYGTVCVPYICHAEGAVMYDAQMSSDGSSVVLSEATELEAGKAYIYKAEEDSQIFSYSEGELVSSPDESGMLKGTFESVQAPVGSYVLQTQDGVQAFYVVVDGQQPILSPYRAYIGADKVQPAESKCISICEDSKTTAVRALNAIISGRARIYDLNGRELKSLQKGVNIVDGVKVWVK